MTELNDPSIEVLLQEHLRRMGERMAELRALQNLSLTQLEEFSGIDTGQLSRIENGKRNISLRTALRIADALGVQLHELFVPPELSQVRVNKRKGAKRTKKSAG